MAITIQERSPTEIEPRSKKRSFFRRRTDQISHDGQLGWTCTISFLAALAALYQMFHPPRTVIEQTRLPFQSLRGASPSVAAVDAEPSSSGMSSAGMAGIAADEPVKSQTLHSSELTAMAPQARGPAGHLEIEPITNLTD